MSKTKKKPSKLPPRARFKCYTCGSLWISDDDPICTFCKQPGTPLTEAAEEITNKRSDKNEYFRNSVQ